MSTVSAVSTTSAKFTPIGRTPLRSRAVAFVPATSCSKQAAPQRASAGAPGGEAPSQKSRGVTRADQWTTVMVRSLPFSYTCNALIDLLDSKGYSGKYDFAYVPIDFSAMLGVGYGFVNFTSHEHGERFMLDLDGFDGWASSFSKQACEVQWSECQGLQEIIARYRNSPVMGHEVPAFYKPVLFRDGARVPFPEPTKKVRPLKCRWPRSQGHPRSSTEAAE